MFKIILLLYLVFPYVAHSYEVPVVVVPVPAVVVPVPVVVVPVPVVVVPAPIKNEIIIFKKNEIDEYDSIKKNVQEKKELFRNKQTNKLYKINIPVKPLPPGGAQNELFRRRNEMIFLKEQASIAEKEYNNLVVQKRKQKILEIKEDMLKYNIANHELY